MANPFMCLNLMFKEDGNVHSMLFRVNEWLFEVLFVVDRVFIAPALTIYVYKRVPAGTPFPMLLTGCVGMVHLFTMLFLVMIINSVKLKLSGSARQSKPPKTD